MISNVEDVQKIIDSFEELQVMAVPVANELARLENYPGQILDEEIIIEEGDLYARWETYCCGGSDYHEIKIPLEYLFDEEWLEEAKAKKLRRNIEAVQKKKEEDAKRERRDKAARYEKHLELCKEFGENS